MAIDHSIELPSRFAELKQAIADSYPDFKDRVTIAWNEIIEELDRFADAVQKEGSSVINLNKEQDCTYQPTHLTVHSPCQLCRSEQSER